MTRSTEKLIHAALRDGCREHCYALIDELREVSDRAHRLETQRDALLEALKKIAAIGNKMWGTDWEEIEEARGIARAAIKAVEEEA